MGSGTTVVGILLGILAALAGAALAVLSRTIQDALNDRREQNKLVSLVRGELLNIERHCAVVKREVERLKHSEIDLTQKLKWTKRKHGDLSFIKGNLAKLGFLNEEMVKEFLQLSLFVRNNDLEIDEIISRIEQPPVDEDWFADAVRRMSRRMDSACSIVRGLLSTDELKTTKRVGTWNFLGKT